MGVGTGIGPRMSDQGRGNRSNSKNLEHLKSPECNPSILAIHLIYVNLVKPIRVPR
jgi:hypothetical protein